MPSEFERWGSAPARARRGHLADPLPSSRTASSQSGRRRVTRSSAARDAFNLGYVLRRPFLSAAPS